MSDISKIDRIFFFFFGTHFFLQHLTYLCIGDFLGALMSIIISAGAMVRDDFFPAPEGRGLLGWLHRPGSPGTPLPRGVETLPLAAPPLDKLNPFMSLLSLRRFFFPAAPEKLISRNFARWWHSLKITKIYSRPVLANISWKQRV